MIILLPYLCLSGIFKLHILIRDTIWSYFEFSNPDIRLIITNGAKIIREEIIINIQLTHIFDLNTLFGIVSPLLKIEILDNLIPLMLSIKEITIPGITKDQNKCQINPNKIKHKLTKNSIPPYFMPGGSSC